MLFGRLRTHEGDGFLVSKFGNISALGAQRAAKPVPPVRQTVNPTVLGMNTPRIPRPNAAQPVTATIAADREWASDLTDQARRLGFLIALVYIVFRAGVIHEVIAARIGNIYFYPLIGLPVIGLAFASGSLRRVLGSSPGRLWFLFGAWMAVSVAFSTWKSDSATIWLGYLQTSLSTLLVVGGLTLTLQDCRRMIGAVALGGTFITLSARYLLNVDREGSDFQGSIGNVNDLAAHFLFVLPFMLCVGMAATSKVVRVVTLGLVFLGLAQAVQSGSRGAMLAAGVVVAFVLIRGSNAVRVGFAFVTPLVIVLALSLLPAQLIERYRTIFEETPEKSEASSSTEARKYLFRTSMELTMEHPVTGVGPSQFANVEGETSRDNGRQGAWQVTHNAYTQVSSETGLPGLLIFVAAIVSTFRSLNRTMLSCRKYAPKLSQLRFFVTASFCLQIALVGFGVAIVFLSQAYSLYLPLLAGLAIAMDRAVQREVRLNGEPVPATPAAPFVTGGIPAK